MVLEEQLLLKRMGEDKLVSWLGLYRRMLRGLAINQKEWQGNC